MPTSLRDVELSSYAVKKLEEMQHRVRASSDDCVVKVCGKSLLCKVYVGKSYMQVIIDPKDWKPKENIANN